jgi:hypothetical protein
MHAIEADNGTRTWLGFYAQPMEATYHFGPNAGLSGGIGRPQPDIRACGPPSSSRTPDLAILSKDPLAIDPMTIDQIEVIETIKEGKTVFSSASL